MHIVHFIEHQKAEIVSKHGIITACKTTCPGVATHQLDKLDQRLVDARYGSLGKLQTSDGTWGTPAEALRIQELWNWIAQETRF